MLRRSIPIRFLILAAVLAGTPIAAARYQAAVNDPDIWWHFRVGDWIWQHHSWPHTLVFTRFEGTNPWVAYSWMFDVITSRVYQWLQLPGLPTFLMAMQIAIGIALFAGLQRVTRNFWPACILTGVALASYFETTSIRPALFSVLFFTIETAIIFLALRRKNARLLYWLPPLFFVWANCHIQFANGLIVVGLLAGCLLVQQLAKGRFGLDEPELPWTTVAMVFVACGLAALLNPYGWELYQVIWRYGTKGQQWNSIIELQAPTFRRPAHYISILMACAAAMSLGWRHSRSVFRVALLVFAAAVAMHALREAWFLGTATAFLLAESFATEGEEVESRFGWSLQMGAVAAAMAIAMLAQWESGYSTERLVAVADRMYPVRAASFIAETHPRGPLYNTVDWGGYLIANLRDYPVAPDPRIEAYGGSYDRFNHIVLAQPGWDKDPIFASANVVLLARTMPLSHVLKVDPEYRLVYEDHLADVFVRVHPR